MQAKMYNKYQQKSFDRYAKAKKTDLPKLITSRYGIEFSGKGNDLDGRGHGIRVTLKQDEWIANGKAVGDAIQTVQQLEKQFNNVDFNRTQAIEVIEQFDAQSNKIGNKTQAKQTIAAPQFKLPATTKNTDELHQYVRSRGISNNTINDGVINGFCERTKDGIMFIGRNSEGDAMNAEIRLMKPIFIDEKLTNFKCAPGSNRSFPPIFSGKDKSEIHLVEGGFSALGLREILIREGKDQTIVVSCGKDNRNWLKHDHVRKMITGANIIVHGENERSEKIQDEANAALKMQCEAIANHQPASIIIKRPPLGIKDNADLNLHLKSNQFNLQTSLAKKA